MPTLIADLTDRLRLGREDRRASAAGRRRAYLFAAGIVAATSWFEPLLTGQLSAGALVTRGLLVLTMLIAVRRVFRASAFEYELTAVGLACQATITWGMLAALSGGAASPMAAFWAAFPLLTVALVPDVPLAGVAVSAVTLLGTTLLYALDVREPVTERVVHVGLAAMGSVIAAYSSVQIARWQRAERGSLQGRKELEAELARLQLASDHADRLATVGGLAASVAHEIANPLAFVGANLRFLKEELEALPGEQGGALVAAVDESARGLERIRAISVDLRGFVRADPDDGRTTPREALEEALRIVALRTRSIAEVHLVVGALPEELPLASSRLVQLVVNLVVNASDAIEAQGRVSLGRIEVALTWVEGALELTVADDGGGIAPEIAARLFEPYFTTKPKGRGTGLGLAVCRRIVVDAGGAIAAEPRTGGGTLFRARVPRKAPGSSDETRPSRPGDEVGSDPMGHQKPGV